MSWRVLAALTLLAMPSHALAGAPISKTEVRALPPAEATRRVAAQLADILILRSPTPTGRPPTRPLRDLDFTTVPRATWVQGVCARDAVVVTFEPVDSPAHGADTLVRASSVAARTTFHLLAPPKAEEAYFDAAPPAAATRACADLASSSDALFFNAPTAEVALSGAWWLTQLAKQSAAPSPDFALTCDLHGQADRTCAAIARDLSIADITAVDPCPEMRQDGQALTCWTISTWRAEGPYEVRLLVASAPDDKLIQVRIEAQAYTSDARVD